MSDPFNLFDEFDFHSILPKGTSAKELLWRNLLLDIIRSAFVARSGAGGDTFVAKYNAERVEALALALQALTGEEE
jgi:hypothetical protein